MQALPPLLKLQSLESTIDRSLRMLVLERALLVAMSTTGYVYAPMVAQGNNILLFSSSQIVECFTKNDMVMLIASKTSLKTAKILEVMHTLVMTLNMSEFSEIASVLLLLCQILDLLQIADNQGYIVACITPKSICQVLAKETEKTRDNTSIASFEVEHQILLERQLLKYKWLLLRAIVLKYTTGEPARLIGVSVNSTSCVQVKLLFCETEKRFRSIFNGSFQLIELLITESIVLEVNQTALNFRELQPQDVVERSYWEIWWALLFSQQHLQYLFSSSPAVIYTCKSYADFGSTFIRENVVAITSYQAREMLEGTSFWVSDIHPLLESFYRAINVGNILGIT
ncbi:hypothetical protein [Nostoc sp. UHCC 0251]|uniref:hypothetical protein n=1 Tax=Nostoc sp. UHCC 0251 TaxID=3110240 RepID=UPI002B20A27C|nr:hypothetical protein [Nostoc sp. UHCC 0251]MEA5622321.1 hypothetical protein [Nostoc sp. UHCC 0251]